MKSTHPAEHYKIGDALGVFGSQARLFSRECVEYLLGAQINTGGLNFHNFLQERA